MWNLQLATAGNAKIAVHKTIHGIYGELYEDIFSYSFTITSSLFIKRCSQMINPGIHETAKLTSSLCERQGDHRYVNSLTICLKKIKAFIPGKNIKNFYL